MQERLHECVNEYLNVRHTVALFALAGIKVCKIHRILSFFTEIH